MIFLPAVSFPNCCHGGSNSWLSLPNMQVRIPIFVAQYASKPITILHLQSSPLAWWEWSAVWWPGSWSRSHTGELPHCPPHSWSTNSRTWWQGIIIIIHIIITLIIIIVIIMIIINIIVITVTDLMARYWIGASQNSWNSIFGRQGRESSPRCGDHPNQVRWSQVPFAAWLVPIAIGSSVLSVSSRIDHPQITTNTRMMRTRDPPNIPFHLPGAAALQGLSAGAIYLILLHSPTQGWVKIRSQCYLNWHHVITWSNPFPTWPDLPWPGALPPVPWRGWVRPCWTHCQITCHS